MLQSSQERRPRIRLNFGHWSRISKVGAQWTNVALSGPAQ
jgi:hypothetical protein